MATRLEVQIQLADAGDIPEMSALILHTCLTYNDPTDFSPEGAAAFQHRASVDRLAERSNDPSLGVIRYKATLGDSPKIVGMSEMYNDLAAVEQPSYKVMYIFVDGAHHGMGIGAKLMRALLARVPGGSGVVLRSAPLAVPFYERFGFQVCGPRTEPEGAGIRGYPMQMVMPPAESVAVAT